MVFFAKIVLGCLSIFALFSLSLVLDRRLVSSQRKGGSYKVFLGTFFSCLSKIFPQNIVGFPTRINSCCFPQPLDVRDGSIRQQFHASFPRASNNCNHFCSDLLWTLVRRHREVLGEMVLVFFSFLYRIVVWFPNEDQTRQDIKRSKQNIYNITILFLLFFLGCSLLYPRSMLFLWFPKPGPRAASARRRPPDWINATAEKCGRSERAPRG